MKHFPTLDHVWLIAALAMVALRPLLTPIPPHDFWWHMAMGREIIQSGAIPATDMFSYTRLGAPFYNQSWLGQVLLYLLHRAGGVPLIIVVQSLVVTGTFGMLLWLCVRRSGMVRLSVVLFLLLVMPTTFDNWNVRPQTYTFPIFVAFLLVLTHWRTAGRMDNLPPMGNNKPRPLPPRAPHRLWLLPPLMLLWVNIHGSFVLGGALITITFVVEGVRRLLARRAPHTDTADTQAMPLPSLAALFWWGGATAAALLVNPRGFGVLLYVRNLLSSSAVTKLVTEWAPPSPRDINGAIFYLFLIVCGVVLARTRRAVDVVDVVMGVAFFWLAVSASRNIVWFVIVMAPPLVVQLATEVRAHWPALPPSFQGTRAINSAMVAMLALLVLVGLPWVKPLLGLPPELGALVDPLTPVDAVAAMRNDPQRPQHLFHDMSYGSYLIWAAPEQPVFADPRIELYPYEQWQEYIKLNSGYDMDLLLEKYAIDGMLLSTEEQATLLERMRARPGWQVRYEDDIAVYLVRE